MKGWKLILVVWSPIIVIGVIYGVLYLTHYLHAKQILKNKTTEYAYCDKQKTPSSIPLNSSGAAIYTNTAPCPSVGLIGHGFLGWPEYQEQ